MIIVVSQESGEMHRQEIGRAIEADQAGPPTDAAMLTVLAALHCRACRTAREVLCLLKGGYADGALARWRAIHEIAVTALFITEQQGDIAQRYLDHAPVEQYKAAVQYQEHCNALGHEPLTDDDMSQLRAASEAAIVKYGETFKGEYGWAAHAMGVPKPTFPAIEARLEMSHWRPLFKLACRSVHAGSRGLHDSLGTPEGSGIVLLAGASDAGLADPAFQTACSLSLASAALLTFLPTFDSLVNSSNLIAICDDIGEEVQKAHDKLRPEIAEDREESD